MQTFTLKSPRIPRSIQVNNRCLRQEQRVFYYAFLLALIICWSPEKSLPFILPYIVVFWFFVGTPRKAFMLRRAFWLLGLGFAWTIIALLVNRDFILQNALLTLLTYSSVVALFLLPSRALAGLALYHRLAKTVLIVIAIEAILGITQGLYGFGRTGTFVLANGDFVQGTIRPSFTRGDGFDNAMFAVIMGFSLFALLPYFLNLQGKGLWVALLGMFALVLASVMHVLFFLLIAATVTVFLFPPFSLRKIQRRWVLILVIFLVISPLLMLLLLSENVRLLFHYYEGLENNPKIILLERLIQDAPQEYPALPFTGIGPGQFASRASLIGTGMYFGGPSNPRSLPLIQPATSRATQHYLMDLWLWVESLPYPAGSTRKPFSSWLALYSEAGLVGLSAIVLGLGYIFVKIRLSIRTGIQRSFAFAFSASVLFLVLLGIQEHYWEVPQAIFIGILLLKVLYANAIYRMENTSILDPGNK